MTVSKETVTTGDPTRVGMAVVCSECNEGAYGTEGPLMKVPRIDDHVALTAERVAKGHDNDFNGKHSVTIFTYLNNA